MAASDEQAVRQAAARFYEALNAIFTGDAAPMAAVWSHADDVTYMGADGGFQAGWTEVLADWQAQAAMNLGGEVQSDGIRVTLGQDLAATHGYVRGHNFDAQGTRHEVAIRDTNLFRKEDGEWKMIGHHSDVLPFIGQ
ncbi:MAG TPA: SgcJ/EcaC family oxidoreductase [Burkholderiales bacterium]